MDADIIDMLKNKLCDACLYKVESMSIPVEALYDELCDRCRERLIKALIELADEAEAAIESLEDEINDAEM